MRILVAHPGPAFSVADVHTGLCEALREVGEHVFEFPLDSVLTFYGSVLMECGEGQFKRALTGDQATGLAVDRLYAAILKVRPHVLISVSAFFLPPELFDIARTAGVKVVIVHTEEPYEHDREISLAPHADLSLITDPTNLAEFQAIGPAAFMPHAYRPNLHYPGRPDPRLECDFAFVGTGYPSRVAFLESMDLTDLDVLLAGNWQLLGEDSPLREHVGHDLEDCVDNAETARIYRSARCGINLYRREATAAEHIAGWSMGPREIEMAACGMFFIRDSRPEGDEVLDMLPTFTGPDEASELLRYWLGHDRERRALADKARSAVADRTFINNAKRLLALLSP